MTNDIEEFLDFASQVSYAISYLCFCSTENVHFNIGSITLLISLEQYISGTKEPGLSIENFTITKFLRSIAQNEKLRQELEKLYTLINNPDSTNNKELHSQLDKVKSFKLKDLVYKIEFLSRVKKKENFTNLIGTYGMCGLYDLITDKDFKQEYIEKAIDEEDEPFSENFRKEMNKYIELAQLGKSVVNKYFEDEGVDVQACYGITENGNVLYANFINYCGVKPIRTSDILQDNENTQQLNVYCNKELEVNICREGKGRNYKFEKGVHYKITSTWPATDKNGKSFECKMIMNVGSNGITKIVKFMDKDCTSLSEEDKKLIEENKELRINGKSLLQAVEEFLGQQHNSGHKKVTCREDIEPIEDPLTELSDTKHTNGRDTEEQTWTKL